MFRQSRSLRFRLGTSKQLQRHQERELQINRKCKDRPLPASYGKPQNKLGLEASGHYRLEVAYRRMSAYPSEPDL